MPESVLVVEDDALLRIHAALALRSSGYEVVEMEDGDAALAYLEAHAGGVSAVFTDVQFAGRLDGFGLARAVAATWPKVRVVVTSGHLRRPRNLPASVRFMPKPWRKHDVLAALAA